LNFLSLFRKAVRQKRAFLFLHKFDIMKLKAELSKNLWFWL